MSCQGACDRVSHRSDASTARPQEVLWEIDRVHMRNRLPIFASTRTGADWFGEGEIGEPIP